MVWPGADEGGEKLVLAAAGVLKLVDQQVANAVAEGKGGFGRQAVVAFECALGDLCDFNEVHPRSLGEDDLELGGGVAEEGEAGLDDLPVVLGVVKRGQAADGGEGGFQAGNGVEVGNQFQNSRLFGFVIGGKTEALVHLFAESVTTGEEQIGQGVAGLESFFNLFG